MPIIGLHLTGGWPGKFLLAVLSTLLSVAALEGLLHLLHYADPPAFEEDVDYGYRLKPNQWAETRGYRFYINRVGLRGKEFVSPKPPDIYRITFLGDSITYGGGSITDSQLFVNRVAAELGSALGKQAEAINISAPGWGIENLSGYVKKMGIFHADLVVWVVSTPDFRRPKTSRGDFGFPSEKPRSRLLYAVMSAFDKHRLPYLFLRRALSDTSTPTSEAVLQRNLELFGSTLAQILREDARAAVVVVPSMGKEQTADRDALHAAAESCSVPFLDTTPVFHQQPSINLYLDGVHLNASGHEKVAAAITEFLKEKILRGPAAQSPDEQRSNPSGVALGADRASSSGREAPRK